MKEFEYTITDEVGLHARPAGKLVMFAKKLKSNVTLGANGKEASGKKMIGVMSLGVKCGQTVSVKIEGENEEEEAKSFEEFLKENL